MGAWELVGEGCPSGPYFPGEGEGDFPRICRSIINGDEVPKVIRGTAVAGGDIPVNRGPTAAGVVEVGRGCWRGCSFCSPTKRTLRHRPLDRILDDVTVNLKAGQMDVILHSEDVFTYGSPAGAKPDGEKVKKTIQRG